MTASRRQAAVPFIMMTVLIDTVTTGLIVPVLPAWIARFTTTPGGNVFWYGVVAFSFGIASFLSAPLLGSLSDRHGRRPILLIGIFGVALSLLMTAGARGLWTLAVARLLCGAMQANLSVAQAYVADICKPSALYSEFGKLGAMMGLGFVLGPALGGVLGGVSLELPFQVAAVLALLNWLYGYFVLPESIQDDKRRPFSWHRANVVAALAQTRTLGSAQRLIWVLGINSLTQITFFSAWVLYTQYRFDWGPRESGLSMFLMGVIAMVVQGGFVAVVSRYLSSSRLIILSLICTSIGYLVYGIAEPKWFIYAAMMMQGLGYACIAVAQSEIVRAGSGERQGQVFGALASINALAGLIGPVLGSSALISVVNVDSRDWRLGMPLYACALIQLVAVTIAFYHYRSTTLQADDGPQGIEV